ncbi:MAG: hypothetical protein IT422_21495 [Pirellulaceae bacterium]|nr:hypothetical protein [Pirellulaceae bacterium]
MFASHKSLMSSFGIGLIAWGLGCTPSSAPPPAPPPAAPAEVVAQQAVAGVGKQGQSLRNDTGVAKMISGPASVLFNTKQKAVLEIQIPQALKLFEASEGRMPKSHDEFMQRIVQANNLALPQLPEGAVYQFNTEKGELWVYPANEVPEQ